MIAYLMVGLIHLFLQVQQFSLLYKFTVADLAVIVTITITKIAVEIATSFMIIITMFMAKAMSLATFMAFPTIIKIFVIL